MQDSYVLKSSFFDKRRYYYYYFYFLNLAFPLCYDLSSCRNQS